jgi:hypothetical protein
MSRKLYDSLSEEHKVFDVSEITGFPIKTSLTCIILNSLWFPLELNEKDKVYMFKGIVDLLTDISLKNMLAKENPRIGYNQRRSPSDMECLND